MDPRHLLRAEGLGVLLGSATAYFALDGGVVLFLLLILAPDVSMIGYLAGPRIGAAAYNAAHVYLAPLALGAAGLWAGTPLATQAALVWAAHIGMDRLVGYGLKYPTGFSETHLRAQPVPVDAFVGEEPR